MDPKGTGFRILPPTTEKERRGRLQNLMALHQQGQTVSCLSQTFWTLSRGMNYNDATLKDLFNHCLDDPLPQWEMKGLEILDFGGLRGIYTTVVTGIPQLRRHLLARCTTAQPRECIAAAQPRECIAAARPREHIAATYQARSRISIWAS